MESKPDHIEEAKRITADAVARIDRVIQQLQELKSKKRDCRH